MAPREGAWNLGPVEASANRWLLGAAAQRSGFAQATKLRDGLRESARHVVSHDYTTSSDLIMGRHVQRRPKRAAI